MDNTSPEQSLTLPGRTERSVLSLSGLEPDKMLGEPELLGVPEVLAMQENQNTFDSRKESVLRLSNLQEILKEPAGANRLQALSDYYLPFERKENFEALQLCLKHCTDRELKALNLSFSLCPYGSNSFSPDYANRLNGCEHLRAKLQQDYVWSKFSAKDLLKLFQLDSNQSKLTDSAQRKLVDSAPPSAQKVVLRYMEDLEDKQISRSELEKAVSLLKGTSAQDLLRMALEVPPPAEVSDRRQSLYSDMAIEKASHLSDPEKEELLKGLGKQVGLAPEPTTYFVSFVAQLARRVACLGREELDQKLWSAFSKPIQETLDDPSIAYSQKQNLAREVGLCARMNKPIFSEITLPSSNMPARFEVLDGKSLEELKQIKKTVTDALWDNDKLNALTGDGLLGQLFPDIFGYAEQGGIKGKKQHPGHDYTLDAHTFMVLHYVRENPQFAKLSQYDQTNLLWAAFLHDIAKREGQLDPDHERASAGVAHGLLSLGYPPQQVTRISTLISRHGDVSYVDPWGHQASLDDSKALEDLAVLYSNPTAATQLRILNEADIKATKFGARLWTPEVESHLNEITKRLQSNVYAINQNRLPILTSDLPRQFKPVQAGGAYAYLVHSSLEMNKLFWDQMGMINSTNCSLSAALVTNEVGEKIYKDVDVVAVLAAPPENFAAAYRSNLLTGHSINWKGHVQQVNDWPNNPKAQELAKDLDRELAKASELELAKTLDLELGKRMSNGSALSQIQEDSSKYNTLDELKAAEGESSRTYQAQLAIEKVMTHDKNGALIKEHNEVKVNNPTVVGLGVFRRNRSISLENITSHNQLKSIFAGAEVPAYFTTEDNPKNSVIIPKRVWQEAKARHLPLLILDN